jgi:23S rRNA A2030 N6-methylase RlmJ
MHKRPIHECALETVRAAVSVRARRTASPTYPGSPLIAMELLGDAAEFVFCDLDGASLATIAQDVRALGVAVGRVRLVQGDGVSTLEEEEASGTYCSCCPIHPSAWKGFPADFASTEFSQVRLSGSLGNPDIGS